MDRRKYTIINILIDFFSTALAWTLFYVYRKYNIDFFKTYVEPEIIFDSQYWRGVILVPLFWLLLYYLSGHYNDVFRRSRINELYQLLFASVFGTVLLFFNLLLDDYVANYKYYYKSVFALFIIHFFITALSRFLFSTYINKKIQSREWGFSTIIIGSNERALEVVKEINQLKKGVGFDIQGFVHLEGKNGFSEELKKIIPHLGEFHSIKEIIRQHQVEEIIIAIETNEHDKLNEIINELYYMDLHIHLVPDTYDLLTGQVKLDAVESLPLITLEIVPMKQWQVSMKRFFDIVVSLFVLIFFSWLYILIGLIVKFTSKGPIIFKQERIGKNGKKFNIYKFRTMYADAEKNGPALSSENDPRITKVGKFLRKTRLDELPQFINVLKGDMSIVGPRPEREYYIQQIVQKAPHYRLLHKIKPGITSWGQVKYGYAENINQMIERMKYDILYLKNMSVLLDLKILIHTVLVIIQGKGK
ncbi:MAG: sugar transferase [Bacteroidia bacterium]|nr:sugar transferase [Bacteroidia bacterium]